MIKKIKLSLLGVISIFLLPFFVFSQGADSAICSDSGLTISLQECLGLVSVYQTTNGAGWTNSSSRLTNPDVNTWYGVTTAIVDGGTHVVGLDLSSNNLQGYIDAGVSDLSYLVILELSSNNITSIPNELSALDELRYLNLGALLLDEIPDGIGTMGNLGSLILDNNDIDSLPETIGGLTSLDYLSIHHNNLAQLPAGFIQLTELDYVDLSNNNFSSFPTFGSPMLDLTILDISNNALTSINDSLYELYELQSLDLSNNLISVFSSGENKLPDLRLLDLGNNQLTQIPGRVKSLQLIEELYFENNQISSFFSTLPGRGNLETLHMHNNQLTELPSILSKSTQLLYLYMHDNPLYGSIPTSWSALTNLRRLYLQNGFLDRDADHTVSVHGEGLVNWYGSILVAYSANQGDSIAPIVGIETQRPVFIDTGSTQIELTINEGSYAITQGGAGLGVTAQGSPECSSIDIENITIRSGTQTVAATIPGIDVYAGCNLVVTDHGGNQSDPISLQTVMYGVDLYEFCSYPGITLLQEECTAVIDLYVHLGGSSWSTNEGWFMTTVFDDWFGLDTAVIGGQEHITGIYLHRSQGNDSNGSSSTWDGNNLIGQIQDSLGDFSELKVINMSNNTITGELPSTLWDMDTLEVIYLGNNQLEGVLPEEINGIESIKTLDLGGNNFTGTLPIQLFGLSTLEILNLTDNLFSGTLSFDMSALSSLRYLNLQKNKFSGEIVEGVSQLSALSYLNLSFNDFTGKIPTTLNTLNQVTTFYLQGNALDRSATYDALLPESLVSRYSGISKRSLATQRDITPPIVSGSGTVPWLVDTGFSYTLTVDENSFAVNSWGDGMEVLFSGGALCESLSMSALSNGNGDNEGEIVVSNYGLYDLCEVVVIDHAENISNSVLLQQFGKASGLGQVCYNPLMDLPIDECLGLISLYDNAGGETWTNNTGWGTDSDITNRYGVAVSSSGSSVFLSGLDLSSNGLSGDLVIQTNFETLQSLNLSNNTLDGYSVEAGMVPNLKTVDLHANAFTGTLPEMLYGIDTLEYIDLSDNEYSGQIPIERAALDSLRYLDLSTNNLSGELPSWLSTVTSLETLHINNNNFSGTLPELWVRLDAIQEIDISQNSLDRLVDHSANIPNALSGWRTGIPDKSASLQSDKTPPTISLLTEIPATIDTVYEIAFSIEENSYAVDSLGNPMSFGLTGEGLCSGASLSGTIATLNGSGYALLVPSTYGSYEGCKALITDHAGNVGETSLSDFIYTVGCGNGTIDTGEECDEGRFCDDGTSCTDDISLCPTQCKTRMKDACNPSCQSSQCGDGYVDSDGLDNIPSTSDDEACDEGRYCSDGTECSLDASLCTLGISDCQVRFTNGCTPGCQVSSCGDGFVDRDGPDNILDNDDDEMCDDSNYNNGDGCSSSCQFERCGDGYLDADGLDNDLATSFDNESCDEGSNNGILGGTCSSTCTIPGEECVFCYEACDGGTGSHSLFLLIDASGSMGSNEKLEKAVAGAKEFIDLVSDRSSSNSGFTTKIGLIPYSSYTEQLIAPTTNYQSIKNAIDNIWAGGGTNFGDPLLDARDYFASHDSGFEKHIILLSDGLPTETSSGLYNAEERAIYGADEVKDAGISLYTISVELSTEGVNLMREISSSPIHNVAIGKSTSQSSTKNNKPSSKAVDEDLSNGSRSQTKNDDEARRDIDLGSNFAIQKIKVWNRTGNNASNTADYHILMSETPFSSTDLTTTLADNTVSSIHETGEAQRPSEYEPDSTARYLRIQLVGENKLALSEVEVMACPVGVSCEDIYSYEDYQGDTIDLIYSHIFGSIHCNCRPEKLCGICGDGFTQTLYGEECDEGSTCPDGSSCTHDPGICPGACTPKTTTDCTGICRYSTCGDGSIQSPNHDGVTETCDDGNGEIGDGCDLGCQVEYCGDGLTDVNGADNIWFTSDDEACDPNDPATPVGCLSDCTWDPGYLPQDAVCNTFDNQYSVAGDGSNAPVFSTLCDVGDPSEFIYNPTTHSWSWYCIGVYGGATESCFAGEQYCGDGIAEQGANLEQCDDGNQVSGDGCSEDCTPEVPLFVPAGQFGSCLPGTTPSLQTDELLPLGRKLYTVPNVDINASTCGELANDTVIPGKNMECTFGVFHGKAGSADLITTLDSVPCLSTIGLLEGKQLANDFFVDHGVDPSELLGSTMLTGGVPSTTRRGKYHIGLIGVDYTICNELPDSTILPSQIHRSGSPLCHYNVTVTSPYILQRGGSFGVIDTPSFANYTDASGNTFFDIAGDSSFVQQKTVSYSSTIMDYLTQGFISSYRGSALVPSLPLGANKGMYKVPNKNIFFYEGSGSSDSIEISGDLLPYDDSSHTVVVTNADIVINGSVNGNGLYIVQGGNIIFSAPDCDETDKIQGIFVTDEGFISDDLHNDTITNQQRCKRGDLHIDGLLLGPGIDSSFVDQRRSLLELHELPSHITDAGGNTLSDEEIKQIKRTQNQSLFERAAVRIQSKPTDRKRLPDGAKDVFEAIEVFR